MKDKKKLKRIYYAISILALSFPIGFLMGEIEAKIAFPAIVTVMGCLQLFDGIFIESKENKVRRIFSLVTGVFFLLFAVLVVYPKYS